MKIGIKELLIMVTTLLTPPTSAVADILKIDSVDGLVTYLDNVNDKSNLVIFDVDMVLLITQGSYFRMPTLKKYQSIYKEMTSTLTPPEKDLMLMYMLMDSPLVPLDDKMVSLVQSLQEKNVTTIAFTAALTGSFSRMANMASWRIFSLEFAGYNFGGSFPHLMQSSVFNHFPPYLGSFPLFNHGVLFANGGHHGPASKGKVLVYFLKNVYYASNRGLSLPQRIIMIDDRKEKLLDMEASLHESFPQISFTGIHFTAAEQVPVEAISKAEFKAKMEEIIGYTHLNKEVLSNFRLVNP